MIPSIAGSRSGQTGILADCIATAVEPNDGLESLTASIDAAVEAASPPSAVGRFRSAWRGGCGLPVDGSERDELAEAAVSNSVVLMGRLLGSRDVNKIVCTNLPEAVVRRPNSCVLLDVAVGAGAAEVSKCLLEFYGAKPTRETLMMAISSGNVEMIRLIWARLPEEQQSRGDLLEQISTTRSR
jgi:hypothetical protein